MKRIISLALVLTLCLSTLTYASSNQERYQWFQGLQLENVIGRTNEGWVVAEEDGVVIVPFDNANPNAQNGRSMPNIVGGSGNDPLLDLLFGLGGTMPKVAGLRTPGINPSLDIWCHCTCKKQNQIGCGYVWDVYIRRSSHGGYDKFPTKCPECGNTNIECVFN